MLYRDEHAREPVIEKYCDIPAFDPIHGQNVFVLPDDSDGLQKTASIVKTAAVSEKCAQFIETMERQPGHAYVLVNGIGAYEYWGPNKNSDAFPEYGLKFGGDEYGHKTFMNGHNFVHHQNKDPKTAVGNVKFAEYNERMHRVEIVLESDLKKLADADPAIYEKVSCGEPVDVSMGAKCDFDVCTSCGNKAATRAEYCECLKKHGGEILGNGNRVCAYTPHPRFFDISYVTRGADRTAKSLQYIDNEKAASDAAYAGHVKTAAGTACPDPSVHDEVECEPSFSEPKFPDDHKAAVAIIEAVEPTIDSKTLTLMAKVGFNQSLSTCSHLGIALKPEEYQRLALVALGQEKIADALDAAGAVIEPSEEGSWFDPTINIIPAQTDYQNFNPKMAELIVDYIPKRSAFEPYFSERVTEASRLPKETIQKFSEVQALWKSAGSYMTPELAAALGLGYLIYRKGLPKADATKAGRMIRDPQMAKKVVMILLPLIAAGSVINKMLNYEPSTKMPSAKVAGIGAEVLLPVGATYLYAAHARRKAEKGKPISAVQHMFLEHPLPLSLASIYAIHKLKGRFRRTLGKSSAIMTGTSGNKPEKTMQKTAISSEVARVIAAGWWKPTPAGVIAATIDMTAFDMLAKSLMGKKPGAASPLKTLQQ